MLLARNRGLQLIAPQEGLFQTIPAARRLFSRNRSPLSAMWLYLRILQDLASTTAYFGGH